MLRPFDVVGCCSADALEDGGLATALKRLAFDADPRYLSRNQCASTRNVRTLCAFSTGVRRILCVFSVSDDDA
ncbi:hypothetical protein [Acuticoccus sp.]|uniref:hypothetical protein n=1 Tax=Acuticoccus sp. TaxID=1904378 RepID=UPI003B530590